MATGRIVCHDVPMTDDDLPTMPDNYMGTFTAHRYTDHAAFASWLGEEYPGQLLEIAVRDQPDPESGKAPTLLFSVANARHLGRLGHTNDAVMVRHGAWVVAYDATEHGGGIAWVVNKPPFEWESALQRPPLDTRQFWNDLPDDLQEQLATFNVRATSIDELLVELGLIEDTAEARATAAGDMRRRLLSRGETSEITGDQWCVVDFKSELDLAGPYTFEGCLRYIAGFINCEWDELSWTDKDGPGYLVYRPDLSNSGFFIRWSPAQAEASAG